MPSIKQSVCYPIFEALLPIDEFTARVAQIGFEAIELWGYDDSLPSIVAAARKHGLVVSSLTGHDSIEHGLNDPSQHDRIDNELRHSIEVCAEHGIPNAICFAGSRYQGVSDVEGLSIAARALRRIAPYAEKHGVNLNLELLNSRVDHYNYMGDSTDWCLALCQMVDSLRVKVLYDVYHAQIMEGDLVRNLSRLLPVLGHVHTGGNPGRAEIDETQEINYRALMTVLKESNYTGYVGHEFFPRRSDPMESLWQAFAICDL